MTRRAVDEAAVVLADAAAGHRAHARQARQPDPLTQSGAADYQQRRDHCRFDYIDMPPEDEEPSVTLNMVVVLFTCVST